MYYNKSTYSLTFFFYMNAPGCPVFCFGRKLPATTRYIHMNMIRFNNNINYFNRLEFLYIRDVVAYYFGFNDSHYQEPPVHDS